MDSLGHELYKKMYLIRKTEEKIQRHYLEDEMKTPMHMSMGEEAIVVGVCHALKPSDQVLGTYRTHALYLAKAMETDKFFAEMYGKVTGTGKGKCGSMHLFAPDAGLICTSAIVASSIPIAVGAAFANKRTGNGKTVAVFFGDGAIDEGAFWESINLACLMKLPVLFVCEDNGYAVHSPGKSRHGYQNIADIVAQFQCNIFRSDSTDVEILYHLTQKAIALMEKNNRPSFLHLTYYRYLEHVGVFDDFNAGYRSRDEFEKWRDCDPLMLQRKKLENAFSKDQIKTIELEIERQIESSQRKAQQTPLPEEHVLYEGLFA